MPVAEFARPTEQVMLDVRVTDRWEAPQPADNPSALSLTLLARQPFVITKDLQLLVSQSEAKVLAASRAVARLGQMTRVEVTDRLEQTRLGLVMDITPTLDEERLLSLELHILMTNLSPTAESRRLDQTVRVADGDTLVMRGLFRPQDLRVDGLEGLPQLGPWFRAAKQHEVVLMLTPHVLK